MAVFRILVTERSAAVPAAVVGASRQAGRPHDSRPEASAPAFHDRGPPPGAVAPGSAGDEKFGNFRWMTYPHLPKSARYGAPRFWWRKTKSTTPPFAARRMGHPFLQN